MHIHIGRTESGRPVKITVARTLTLDEILIEASEHKGMELIGIIDCHSSEVLAEIEKGVSSGRYTELEDGGIKYKDTVLLCGSELEINDDRCRVLDSCACLYAVDLRNEAVFRLALRKGDEYPPELPAHL